MRRIAPVLVLALVASLALGNVALADAAGTKTSFSMNHDSEDGEVRYRGRVRSDRKSCIKGRIVEIYHNGVLIGQDETDSEGRWRTTGPVPPNGDDVTAKVLPKKRDGRVICKGAKVTETFVADQD